MNAKLRLNVSVWKAVLLRNPQARIALLSILLLFAAVNLASAEGKRIALVIGNSTYSATTRLPNAVSDASAFATFLHENGFVVERLIDVDRSRMAQGLAKFTSEIGPGDTALFYFAGHGMQLRGENFLLGLDAKLQSEFDVYGETISLDSVIDAMERTAAVSLLFIDACRNNPIADRLNTGSQGPSRGGAQKGLAPVNATGTGTMIAFSASPGSLHSTVAARIHPS